MHDYEKKSYCFDSFDAREASMFAKKCYWHAEFADVKSVEKIEQ
jgi:hypothetical protein